MTGLHDRMPVILDGDDDGDVAGFPTWPGIRAAGTSAAAGWTTMRSRSGRVSRDVNNTRHNEQELIEPVDDPEAE